MTEQHHDRQGLSGGKITLDNTSGFLYSDDFARTNFTLRNVYIVLHDVCVNGTHFQTSVMENLRMRYINRGAYAENLGNLDDNSVVHLRKISSQKICIYLKPDDHKAADEPFALGKFIIMNETGLRILCNKLDILHAAHKVYIQDHPTTKSLPVTDLSNNTTLQSYLQRHEGFGQVLKTTFTGLKRSIGSVEKHELRGWINAIQPKMCREHLKRKATQKKSTVVKSESPTIIADQPSAANNEVEDCTALDNMVDGPVEYSDLLEAIRRLPKQEVNPFWVETHGTTPPPAVGPSDYAKNWEWYYPEGEVDPGSPPRDRPAHAGIKGNKWMYDIYWNSDLFKGRLDMPESSNVTAERLRKVDTDLFEKWTDEKGLEKEAEKGLEKEAEKKHEKEYEKE